MRSRSDRAVSTYLAVLALVAQATGCTSVKPQTAEDRQTRSVQSEQHSIRGGRGSDRGTHRSGVGRLAEVERGRASGGRWASSQSDALPKRPAASEPADDTDGEPLTIAVVSDMNGSYGSTTYGEPVHRTIDWLTDDLRPDLVISTGDHVAGQKEGLDYAQMWEAFHDVVTRPLAEAGIPFAPTPGNHDASAAPRYRQERRQYRRQWRRHTPDVEFVDRSDYPTRYAFEVGQALFVSLDATMPDPLSDEQYQWVESVLEQNADKPTKIVYGHLPLVPFAEGRQREVLRDDRLEALLKRQGVDVMLSGHHHAYYPGRRGDLRLVGLSCLGGGRRQLLGRDRRSRHSAVTLEVSAAGAITVAAHYGAHMQKTVDHSTLPRTLGRGRWRMVRHDIKPPRQVVQRSRR